MIVLMLEQWRHRSRINSAIREAIDSYPGGLCFAAPDGRVILANRAINALCGVLTGHTIMNAALFWTELAGLAEHEGGPRRCRLPQTGQAPAPAAEEQIFALPDGRIWGFRRQQLDAGGQTFVQIEASDITEYFHLSESLYENNLRLAALQERQKLLIRNIMQINLEKEILDTKIRIHDQFGHCLVATKKAIQEGALAEKGDGLARDWESAVLAMTAVTGDSENKFESPEAELMRVAELIGCRVCFVGAQPRERRALLLLYAAVREALTNAVRHASANCLTVAIETDADCYRVRISSNGKRCTQPVKEGNGLGNLRRRLEQEGAQMRVLCEDGVVLALTIPRKNPQADEVLYDERFDR